MEVHAHTHTARKKWTHYFWEFLMLFLAVFCGFLAENQRDEDNNVNRIGYNPALRLTDDAKHRLNYRIHMLTVFNKTMRLEAKRLLAKATNLNGHLKKEYHLK